MYQINLQLFSGGGGNSHLGGGGKGDAANSTADTYRFTFTDENGNVHVIDIRGDSFEEAKELLKIKLRQMGIKKTKDTKVEKLKKQNEKVSKNVTEIVDSISDNSPDRRIDLSESPLSYTNGAKVVSQNDVQNVRDIAKQIKNKNKENLIVFDNNGKVIYNKEGEVDRVSAPQSVRQQAKYDVHNHVGRDGFLGGSFSVVDENGNGDMVNFVGNSNTKAKFVSAKEGVYYIEKTDSFRPKDFFNHMKQAEAKIENGRQKSIKNLEEQYNRGKINYETYKKRHRQIQNKSLVDMHNEYLKNQGRYGYNYGLMKD